MSQALQDDDDPWSQTGRSASAAGADDDFTSPGGVADEDTSDVVDALATEVPPRKKGVGPKIVIGIAVLAVVGIAGSGMYNLYRKIVPAPEVAATQDRSETPVDALPTGVGTTTAGLPGMPQPASAATTIGATQSTALAQTSSVDPAAFAVGPAAAPASAPAAVVVAAPAVAATAAAAPAPAAAVPTPPASAVTVAAATAVAAAAGPTPEKAAAVRPEKATVAAKPKQITKAASKKEKRRAAAARKQRGSGPQAAVARADRAVRKSATTHRTGKAGGSRGPTPASGAPATEQTGTGALINYRIESIEPRFGEHQNAWIRSRDGRLHVVATGDTLDGGRVIKVDGAAYQVQTTQGVIR